MAVLSLYIQSMKKKGLFRHLAFGVQDERTTANANGGPHAIYFATVFIPHKSLYITNDTDSAVTQLVQGHTTSERWSKI